MADAVDFWDVVERIRQEDGRFAPEAYAAVMDGLEFAMTRVGQRRHVSGPELLEHMCDYLKSTYGVLAYSVLAKWGITATRDVGAVVFQLVEAGILSKTNDDAQEDFDAVFDLRTRLEDGYFDDATG
jgi:uncharacterized repeat protein (TIGR04138 family)